METDEKIMIAEKLSRALIGVDRNEFSKWISFLKNKQSLDKALTLAKYLSATPMLRPIPRRSYERIYKAISQGKKEIQDIDLGELLEILGYCRLFLIGETASLKGTLKGVKFTRRDVKKAYQNVFQK